MLPLRLSEIAELVGGDLAGPADLLISGAAGLAEAGAADLSFVADPGRLAEAAGCGAGALLVGRNVAVDKPAIAVDDPYRAFATVLAGMRIPTDRAFPPGVHPTAVVHPDADVSRAGSIGALCVIGAGAVIGPGTRIGPLVSVGCDVIIGADCVVHPQVVIREGCQLGQRVIVHAAAVIGSDGFGYLPGPAGMEKIPQVGIVCLEDDVEIGAGATIDRATTGRTVIGLGTKIDNQVQIAHNVRVGRHCALSAQVGIAGSAELGDGVVCGGQVGIGDHIVVGAGTKIGGQGGVISDLPAGSRVFGTPAHDVKEFFRVTAATRRAPALRLAVRDLKLRIAELEARLADAAGEGSGVRDDQEI